MDALQHRPANGVAVQQVRKELGGAPQLVGVEVVRVRVLLLEHPLVHGGVGLSVEVAETLGHEGVILVVRARLGAALERHLADLDLFLGGDVDAEDLVDGLLVAQPGHEGEVYALA